MGRVWWILAAVVAAITTAVALHRPPEVRLSDLSVYLGATAGLEHGASLYDFIRGAAPFTYPPFAALILRPLTGAPLAAVQIAWSLATVATVAGLAVLISRDRGRAKPLAELATLISHDRGQAKPLAELATLISRGRAGPLALILMLSAPIASNLKYGQVSLFLAGWIAIDLLALRRTRWFGSLIGVAAAVKLTPLIFIPLLWLAGRRTAALTATAAFAACTAAGALVLPGDSWRFFSEEIFRVSRLGYITSAGNQSLNGALLRFGLDTGTRTLVVVALGGAVAAIALWRAGRLARGGDWLSAMVVVGAASVVLSPVSWTHHQVWLVLAVLLPVRRHGRVWAAMVLGIMLLPVTALGPPVWTNSRLLLAIAVAALVPLAGRAPRPAAAPAPQSAATVPPHR